MIMKRTRNKNDDGGATTASSTSSSASGSPTKSPLNASTPADEQAPKIPSDNEQVSVAIIVEYGGTRFVMREIDLSLSMWMYTYMYFIPIIGKTS